MMAFGFFPVLAILSLMASSRSSGDMFQVLSSESTNTGFAPQYTTGLVEAQKLNDWHITSSPSPTFKSSNARWMAAVQELRAATRLSGEWNPEGLTDRMGGKVESGEEEEEDEISEENESAYFIEDIDDVADEETQLEPEPEPETEEEPLTEMEEEPQEEPETIPTEEPEHNSSDDLGFILNFEPVSEEPQQNEEPQQSEEPQPSETPTEEVKEEIYEEPTVFTSGDEIEMEVKDEELGERSKEEEEIKNEEEEVKYEEEVKEEEIVYEPVVIGDMTDHDDSGFELEQPETVGERYQQGQEETVGERLQHSSVRDLQSAIGINDKFLFVNELFGGSMEKYNRSIENLNDLKTLNGALIYLNELRIELQWNSSNEAYKKLLELVHRKFES